MCSFPRRASFLVHIQIDPKLGGDFLLYYILYIHALTHMCPFVTQRKMNMFSGESARPWGLMCSAIRTSSPGPVWFTIYRNEYKYTEV